MRIGANTDATTVPSQPQRMARPSRLHPSSGHKRDDDHNTRFSIARLFGSERKERSSIELVIADRPDAKQAKSRLDELDELELRRHVRAVTMGDERPLPISTSTRSLARHRHSADLGCRTGSRRLISKRRAASVSTLPFDSGTVPENPLSQCLVDRPQMAGMASTVTVQPLRLSRFEVGPPTAGLESIDEDQPSTPRTPTTPTISYHPFPSHSGYASPTSPTKRFFESPPPAKLNSPRKLSGSSTTSTVYSRESARSELAQASSWGSKSSFESFESGQWRPVDSPLGRPEPLKKRRTFDEPGRLFSLLPGEVLGLILGMLKQQHLGPASEGCATCWMRDLCNICLSSRSWAKFAKNALYEDIRLVGADSAAHRKKYKLILGPRLLMLRKTLRSNPNLASLVRSVKVPRPDPTVKGFTAKHLDQYEDLVASLVMVCPNLETLSGLNSGYDYSFKKIFHALSTRSHLKGMNWLIEPLSAVSPKQKAKPAQSGGVGRTNSGLITPSELDMLQANAFLDHHCNWYQLTSLSIHCVPGAVLPESLLTRVLTKLPSITQLYLCNLPATAFNDKTLLSLPPLRTLSLTHVSGITSAGLSSFATCSAGRSLRTLHLRHTPLTSLPALARIFSNLTSLADFALVQTFPPLMPEADTFALWMMPYLASATIKKLHWDITSHRDCANVADDILAKSIIAAGFPLLTLLRAPHDPEAIFQGLCRPVESIALPLDRFSISSTPAAPVAEPVPASPVRFLQKSPRTPQSPMEFDAKTAPACTDLRLARMAAQARLQNASSQPRFSVFVTSEEGHLVDKFQLAGFIGTVGSPIRYHLLPDAGSTDQKGGIVDVRDLAGDHGESLASGREGCTGAWNRQEGTVADRKERELWWHTERGRWTGIKLP